jgi:hypothetical protein
MTANSSRNATSNFNLHSVTGSSKTTAVEKGRRILPYCQQLAVAGCCQCGSPPVTDVCVGSGEKTLQCQRNNYMGTNLYTFRGRGCIASYPTREWHAERTGLCCYLLAGHIMLLCWCCFSVCLLYCLLSLCFCL